MRFSFRHLLVASLLLTSGAAIAASPPLTWRGDITTADGFVHDMAAAWHKAGHPRITLQPFNTISGIDAVADGKADIAGSARRRAPHRANESDLVFTPVAWEALVLIVHRHNPVDNLTLKQLHDIYYGKITNWKQLGGKNEPIHVYSVASPTDGIQFSMRRLVFGRGRQPVAAPRLYLSVKALQQAVALDPQSIGLSALSNAYGKPRLKMLSIDGTSPSTTHVADGSYPLYTPLYLVTRPDMQDNDPARATEISQFMDFARSPKTATILRKHHLVPYVGADQLDGHDAQHMIAIAHKVGRALPKHHNGPTAAARATYAAGAAIAPTSRRTRAARQRAQAERKTSPDFQAAPAPKGSQATAATRPPHAARVTSYTVQSGDTLSKIANKKSVTVDQLRKWNDIHGNLIHVGQKIEIHHRD